MIDHVILAVSDFERSVAFYSKALKPLGITNFTDYEGHDGHPDSRGPWPREHPLSSSGAGEEIEAFAARHQVKFVMHQAG